MTLLSGRQNDAFDNPAKMACREGNLCEAAYPVPWRAGKMK